MTISPSETTPPTSNQNNCDSAYPDFCIPSPPPDLNCPDIPQKNFKVLPPDPHGFDRDGDSVGCET
jgi:micrococcal nuclease